MTTPKTVTIDGVEHDFDSLSDQQKGIIQHITDLEGKIGQARFQLDQLSVARDAFMGMLKASFEAAPAE